jgi:hypothetical protein
VHDTQLEQDSNAFHSLLEEGNITLQGMHGTVLSIRLSTLSHAHMGIQPHGHTRPTLTDESVGMRSLLSNWLGVAEVCFVLCDRESGALNRPRPARKRGKMGNCWGRLQPAYPRLYLMLWLVATSRTTACHPMQWTFAVDDGQCDHDNNIPFSEAAFHPLFRQHEPVWNVLAHLMGCASACIGT